MDGGGEKERGDPGRLSQVKRRTRGELEELSRKEDREYRKLQDNRKDKLLALGTYKSGRDLSLFLAKFEKVMAACKEPKNN